MRRLPLLLMAALFVLSAVSLVYAQAEEWDLGWHSISGGGSTSIGGDRFVLSGTVGQPDAGDLSGGVYTLNGGFWAGTAAPGVGGSAIYLPLVLK